MPKSNSEELHSIKKLRQSLIELENLKRFFKLVHPLLRLFHVRVEEIDKALDDFDQHNLRQEIDTLSSSHVKFNEHFSALGWISYDLLKLDVAKQAVALADSGDLTSAENELVNYYTPETIRWHLRTMKSVKAFQPRFGLAQKALMDYEEERYHASIPVVLMLVDGTVNEIYEQVTGKKRGFFAEDVDLSAWDSFASHNGELSALAALFRRKRNKTSTEQISLPYLKE
jgi:hypothetical protein